MIATLAVLSVALVSLGGCFFHHNQACSSAASAPEIARRELSLSRQHTRGGGAVTGFDVLISIGIGVAFIALCVWFAELIK
jgi:hypothetical protein